MRTFSTKAFVQAARKQGGFSLITAFIMIIVLLSAVLYFSFGRAGSTHDTTNTVARGHAQTILSHAASLQAGIDHLIYKGEDSVSITLDRVYNPALGGILKQKIAASPYTNYAYAPWSYRVSGIRVANIGTGSAAGGGSGAYSDYIATGGVSPSLCTAFNQLVGISGTPSKTVPITTAINPGTTTTGGTGAGQSAQLDLTNIPAFSGKRQFCLNVDGAPPGFIIFQIVVPR